MIHSGRAPFGTFAASSGVEGVSTKHSTRRPDPSRFGLRKFILLIAIAGAVALALRPDWKTAVGQQVREIRSRLLPQFQELVRRTVDRQETPVQPRRPESEAPRSSSDLVATALAFRENEPWRSWDAQPHDLRFSTPRMQSVPFSRWDDPSSCVEGWEGDAPIRRSGCVPNRIQIEASIDAAAAEAIRRHYGIPKAAIWASDAPGCRAAIDDYIASKASLHGVDVVQRGDGLQYRYSPGWLVLASAPFVERLAASVVLAASGRRPDALSDRAIVEALAGYVQAAVPYQLVDHSEVQGQFQGGLRTPLMTLLEGGDCDSKCLLLATLIRSLRPSVPMEIIFVMGDEASTRNDHAVLSVGVPPQNSEWKRNMACGMKGVLIETTNTWGIGHGFREREFTNLEPLRIP